MADVYKVLLNTSNVIIEKLEQGDDEKLTMRRAYLVQQKLIEISTVFVNNKIDFK